MESINLNLIPQGANPVVHAKQFDEGRGFRFNLFNGTAPIVLTGAETITCNVKKPDGNLVTVAVTNTSSNYVEVYTTLQMCACYGANLGEIRLEEDGNDIGTLNFTLSVEESPLNNGIESESSIHNLETQVAGMVAEEVATQYDSANVIFDNAPTENHGIGYTVTSEGIKTAIDNAFDYDNTASGSLVHITDGADNIPVKSLVSEIVAVESGNGQPKSPSNPYTISGFANGVVSVCSKNLINLSDQSGSGYIYNKEPIFLKSGTYNFSFNISVSGGQTLVLRKDNTELFRLDFTVNIGRNSVSFTISDDANNISLYSGVSGTFTDFQIELGETATTFEAYNGNTYTFTFGQTVYGGHFDNKGNAVVTHKEINLSTLSWSATTLGSQNVWRTSLPNDCKGYDDNFVPTNILCEQYEPNSVDNMYSGYSGISLRTSGSYIYCSRTDLNEPQGKLIAELITPITLSITSQDIPTLLGENNIFSNCGDCEVNYYTSKSNDILDFINSEIDKKNGTNIPIEANSQDSIKDYVDNGLGGKADTSDLNDKQNKNVLNIVKHYDTGTSSDAITDIITEYGKVNMVFAFDVPLGYFTGCLTFANDNMGSGFIVLSTTGRFWVVSYVSGTITLTELT